MFTRARIRMTVVYLKQIPKHESTHRTFDDGFNEKDRDELRDEPITEAELEANEKPHP